MTALTPNGEDSIIAEFMQQFEGAADKAAVVRLFADRHPHLGPAFADYAAGHRLLKDAGPGGEPAGQLLRPGETLGDFRVVRLIDKGGMGEIYEAEQVRLKRRRVALKVIRRGRTIPEARARFDREQTVLANLHQTNIVPVFANGEKGEVQYFAMQYIDGATLGRVVKHLQTRNSHPGGSGPTSSLAKLVESAVGPAPGSSASTLTAAPAGPEPEPAGRPVAPVLTDEYLRSVASSLADVADALHAAHEAGVVHRDVKPSNLMAEKSGKCWVIDFGMAGLVGESLAPADGRPAADPALTATGSVMGTFAYMAPEQFGGTTDRRSDVWALGVTLYELLALERPFPGPDVDDYKRQIGEAKPADLRALSKAIPRDLAAVCRKAMRKAPADRYPTAVEFAADLRRWLRHEPTAANPPWVWRRVAMWAHRQPGWASMVGVACAAVLAVVGLVLEMQRRKTVAANERADQEARESEAKADAAAERVKSRNRLIQAFAFQRGQFADRQYGWRDRQWATGLEFAQGGTEPELRDRMAAILSGLDANPITDFVEGPSTFLAFDSTGNRLAMGGFADPRREGGVDRSQPTRVRDLRTGAVRQSRHRVVGPVGWRGQVPVHLVPPPEGQTTFVLWDIDGDRPVEEFALLDGYTTALAIEIEGMNSAGVVLSADTRSVAAFARGPKDERLIVIWRSGTRLPWKSIPISVPGEHSDTEALTLAPDGSLVAHGTDRGTISVWSLSGDPKRMDTFDLGRSPITALAFARNRIVTDAARLRSNGAPGWYLAAGDAGGHVVVWDLARLDRVMMNADSHNEIYAIAFDPDATIMYSTGRRDCRIWDVASGRPLLVDGEVGNVVPAIAISPTRTRLATGSIPLFWLNVGTKLLALERSRGIQTLHGLRGQVALVAMTRDGRRAAGMTPDWQIGVWDVPGGELLMRLDAPTAPYAEHDDIRLADDGLSLIVAGATAAHRWRIPDRPGEAPADPEKWDLKPAFPNRLAVAPDGTVLLCRNETANGREFPFSGPARSANPCRLRVYELPPGGVARQIAEYDDHPWFVNGIFAVPDGSSFIANGVKGPNRQGYSITAYSGREQKRLWDKGFADSIGQGGLGLDSSGRVLRYSIPFGGSFQRRLPYLDGPDQPVALHEGLAFDEQVVFREPPDDIGVHLGVPGASTSFLVLSPDDSIPGNARRFSVNGQFLAWGTESGAIHVCELERVRRELSAVGLGWK